ncbi:MAG: prolyl oligopeptidase family serine peptidase [Planctomycetota bacterium]|nr:prolyl oligopeptidase family serine peptidase [Planctomycetota bacterium]
MENSPNVVHRFCTFPVRRFFLAWGLLLTGCGLAASQEEGWSKIRHFFEVPEKYRHDMGEFTNPLEFPDGSRVRTPQDWTRRRRQIFSQWEELLGRWPRLLQDQQVTVLDSEKREAFTQSKVEFRWAPGQTTRGYLLLPEGKGPFPAVVTVFYEPETAIGQGKPFRDFAYQLVRRGFVCLSIGTTEASRKKTYSLYFPSIENARVQPLSMLGCAAANAWCVLSNHPQVDAKRIGIVGHSFGGKWAMFACCLFDRFACAAWSDPGIVFDTRSSVNYWEPWYLGYHPKPWRKRGLVTRENPARGLYPRLLEQKRDLHELHVLMAPRPFLVSGGSEDPVTRWRALNHSVAVNRVLGRSHRVGMTNRPGHSPTRESNEVIYRFFEHFLSEAAFSKR